MSGPIAIRDVLPRDGFQDLPLQVPVADKARIVRVLWEAGLRWIEVSSFVSPTWVPQLADAEEVVAGAKLLDGLVVSAFVPNRRGLERAIAAEVDEVSLAVAVTDALARENFDMGREQALAEALAVAAAARQASLRVSVTIGGALGCPFEGAVDGDDVVALAVEIADAGVPSIFLADTIGAGSPEQVGALVSRVRDAVGVRQLGVHLHGGEAAIDGVVAAVRAGADAVDCSTTGVGGCPFVPEAPGNVDTALVTARLDAEGIAHDQDTAALQVAARLAAALLKRSQDPHAELA